MAAVLFMAASGSFGAFGPHPTTHRPVRPGFVDQADALALGRLVFLAGAVAVVPVIVGALTVLIRATACDGTVLLIDAVAIARP